MENITPEKRKDAADRMPVFMAFLFVAIGLYGLFGTPTPDDPGLIEALIGALLGQIGMAVGGEQPGRQVQAELVAQGADDVQPGKRLIAHGQQAGREAVVADHARGPLAAASQAELVPTAATDLKLTVTESAVFVQEVPLYV